MFGRGTRGSRRRLHLRSAGRAVWSPGQRRLVLAAVLLVTLPALGWGLALGHRRLMRHYLLESGRFVLREIEIEAGDTITADRVREYLKLREGMPLFALDIARRQREFVRDASTIRSLTITRRLPDRIVVSLVEREPLARLARKPLAVDREGCIFPRYLSIETLPCISGYPTDRIVPGARVVGMARAALELLDLLRNHSLPLPVVDVDVSREDYLDCTLSDQRRVKLAWPRMGASDARSERLLLAQLKGLAAAMNSERGQGRGIWDATIPGRAYAR